MADPSTPEHYIASLEQPRRNEIQQLHDLIRATLPEHQPYIRSGMLAYGAYRYRYASGRAGDWSLIALASQQRYISLYVMSTKDGAYLAEHYVGRLPKANIGKSCVRFRRLADVDLDVVRELLAEAGRTGPPHAV